MSQGTSFYECKLCDILLIVVSLLKINRHIYSITALYLIKKGRKLCYCDIFSIVWPSVLYSLQLFKPIDNKKTVVKGKLKFRPIICIYVMYVTISIRYGCFFFF